MARISVRYIVDDVDEAIRFHTGMLGFQVEMHPAPGFAALATGDLRLLLNRPGAGGPVRPCPDGRGPGPGGWNRIRLQVEDLAGLPDGSSRPAAASETTSCRGRPARRS